MNKDVKEAKELNKQENEFLGNTTPSVEKPEVPEGFTAINPPATTTSTEADIVSKEATEHVKALDTLVKDLTKNFVKIGYELLAIQQKKLYKELGFKTFDDFVKIQYGFSRSSAYNFINVCVKYSVRDDAEQPTKLLKKEYSKFSSSQLVAMLKLNDEAIAQVDPSATVKDIKKLAQGVTDEDTENTGDTEESIEESGSGKEKKEKKNVRDVNIPVMRLNMATGATWDSVVTEAIRKVCEPYLNDARRQTDGRNYKIEINIVYPDESAM